MRVRTERKMDCVPDPVQCQLVYKWLVLPTPDDRNRQSSGHKTHFISPFSLLPFSLNEEEGWKEEERNRKRGLRVVSDFTTNSFFNSEAGIL